jgi:hemerythrin-like metal-binding protein
MVKINWSPEYSVGVGMLDEQHKRLVLMLNRMIDTREAATGSQVVSEMISRMTAYAQEHFKFEEDLLTKIGFPRLDQHIQSHNKFRKKIVDLCMAVPLGVSSVPQVMLNFHVQWWQNHILQEDMQYRSFFEEQGMY